jgi:hypothetical protein
MGMRQLVATIGAMLGLWPAAGMAQLVQPFLPVPTMPVQPLAIPATVEPPPGTTVITRPRPEIDAQGMRLGSFFFFPRGELDASYNDNIFATPRGTGAFIMTLAPSFDLLSNWDHDAVNFHGGGAFATYTSHSSENYNDAFASADGRLDISEGSKAYGGLQILKLHESRYSPNSPGAAAEPVRFMNYGGNLAYEQSGLRIGYRADFTLNRYEYEAPPRIGGGFVPQSDRNMTTPDLALRGSYEFAPNLQAYLRGEGNLRNYDHGASAAQPARNSAGYRIDTGVHADLTGVTAADAYVGYLEQDYRSRVYSTVRGIDFGAKLTWNPTTLDTVQLRIDRSVQDLNSGALPPGITSSAYLETVASATEDHELLRDLIISGNVSYINDKFSGINRTDNVYALGTGAKYFMNRFVYLGFSYSYAHRSSGGTQATTPYSDNILMLRLSTQL